MIYLILSTLFGFIMGWIYCNVTYVRYRRTSDAMLVVNEFQKNRRKT